MDFTPYNNFPKPADDEAFGDEYRGFADNLDPKVREEGPIADRPLSAPTGAIYDATDQQVRYRYDGSSWAVIGGIGSAAKPLPSVTADSITTQQVDSSSITPGSIDSIEYCAVGDDVQTKIDNLSSGRGMVVFERGTHTIDSSVQLYQGVSLVGANFNSTRIETTGDFPVIEAIASASNRMARCQIEGLQLANGASGGTADLFRGEYFANFHFRSVRFEGSTTTGSCIHMIEGWDHKFSECFFDEPGDASALTAGVYMENTSNGGTNGNGFVNCRFEPLRGHAIYADSSASGPAVGRTFVSNCKFHGDPNAASHLPFFAGQHSKLQITNCFSNAAYEGFADITGNGFLLSNTVLDDPNNATPIVCGATQSAITNNWISTDTTYAIDGTADDIIVSSNVLKGTVRLQSKWGLIGNNNVREGGKIELNADRAIVSSNQVNRNDTADAIYLSGNEGIAIGNLIVGATRDGVRLGGMSGGSIVVGNKTVSCGGVGVSTRGSSDYTSVVANVDNGSTNGGLSLSGSNNATAANISL